MTQTAEMKAEGVARTVDREITVGLCSRNRKETLKLVLESLADQSIHPDPESTRWRHALLECTKKFLINQLRLRVAELFPPAQLLLKSAPLLVWIREFRKCICQLAPGDKCFKSLRETTLYAGRNLWVSMHPGQRRYLSRVVGHNSRCPANQQRPHEPS